jgi:hypothetical protein
MTGLPWPVLVAGLVLAMPALGQPSIERSGVVLQALDKVTARVQPLEAPIGVETQFGGLLITPRACLVSTPTEAPESAAFLEIREVESGDELLFSGWMFASSPGLSALEHSVYDIWVLQCAEPPADDAAADPSTTQSPNG